MSRPSPFASSTSKPGHGTIHVATNTRNLRTLSYQYPLKLVTPDALSPPDLTDDKTPSTPKLVHTVFLLSYGGGIIAGDTIDLTVRLENNTRLVLLTQGSTKIFKTLDPKCLSRQHMTAHIAPTSALVYLPDPVQPFAQTAFSQSQIYHLANGQGSLCVCDWVTSGRSARGENWDLYEYRSRNEVYSAPNNKLLLRDNLILDANGQTNMPFSERMDGYSVFGTLIVHGPAFQTLAKFFMDEFDALPRIGGRNWGDTATVQLSPHEQWRARRQQREKDDGVIWSAANVRGFTVVKFASRAVEGSRDWLKDMVVTEGSVTRSFGERAILCLK